jgi:hypothetical protein
MTMTLKEMNRRVFRREPVPHVFFQPRFEPWVAWHTLFDTMPPKLAGKSVLECYDMIGASMRTVHYYTGNPSPIETSFNDEVRVTEQEADGLRKVRYDTPHGPLFEAFKYTADRTWRRIEFAAKRAEDLPALRWLIEREMIRFSLEKFRVGERYVGDRGVPQFWVPKSPYFACAQSWFKYADFIYALTDCPGEMEDIFRAIDDSYDALYEQLCSAGVLEILNFGENVAMAYLSMTNWQEYCMPWYAKRAGQLHDAGIFSHIHIDGYFRPLLPTFKDLPFDGLEALTPEPQGDVTLEEIKENIGEKILLDGIPAVYFLDHHCREELERCVERVVELFHPNLVLGISDELPEAGGEEAFDRLAWVADYARTHGTT